MREKYYELEINQVVGNFIPERDDFLLGQVLCDFVLHIEVTEDLVCSGAANSMDVLQRVFHPLVIRNLTPSHSHAPDAQPEILRGKMISTTIKLNPEGLSAVLSEKCTSCSWFSGPLPDLIH